MGLRKVLTQPPHSIVLTNLLSFIYAQIYFPTYSNGLKEISGYLGFRWSGSPSSGLGDNRLAAPMGGNKGP